MAVIEPVLTSNAADGGHLAETSDELNKPEDSIQPENDPPSSSENTRTQQTGSFRHVPSLSSATTRHPAVESNIHFELVDGSNTTNNNQILEDEPPQLVSGALTNDDLRMWEHIRGDVDPSPDEHNFAELNNRVRARGRVAGSSGDGFDATWRDHIIREIIANRARLRPRRRNAAGWNLGVMACVMRGAVLALALSFWTWRGSEFWSCLKSATQGTGGSAGVCVHDAFDIPFVKMPWIYSPVMFGLTLAGTGFWLLEFWDLSRMLFFKACQIYLAGEL